MATRKCGKVYLLMYGSYSCERPRGHKGLHRKYAIRCPGGMRSFTFSNAGAKWSKEQREE